MNSTKNIDLEFALACPTILSLVVLVGAFFLVSPETRVKYLPALKEYSVKLDFNEVARLRENAIRIAMRRLEERRKFLGGPQAIPDTDTGTSDEITPPNNNTEFNTSSSPPEATEIAAVPADSAENVPDLSSTVAYLPPQVPAIAPKNVPSAVQPPARKGKPIKFVKATLKGVPFYQATVDLKDPEIFLNIELANNADEANSATSHHGDESFASLVQRSRGAVVQNGTFFSKDDQKRVMGNMVARGRYLKYSQWENYGTTLGIKKNNEPEMITARLEGQPDWSQHWFSITCGPRLLRNGSVEIKAESEGFQDSHVLGVGPRCAIGYPAEKDKLYIVTFLKGLSLKKEAEVMQAMGCSEAMNLDGGASRGMAHNGTIVVPAQRALTNVIVVYDTKFPAPQHVIATWQDFQKRPDQTIALRR